jgi:hypothetical protein
MPTPVVVIGDPSWPIWLMAGNNISMTEKDVTTALEWLVRNAVQTKEV